MLSRAHVRIHWFAFSSRHLDHLAVDSELVGCAGWNSGFLVSITWFNPFYCKKKKQFGERYDIFHLKPVFLELFKPRGNGFSPSRNTPPKKSFSIFSKSLSLLKISLDWKVLISLQTSSKTFKRHAGRCKEHGRGVQDTSNEGPEVSPRKTWAIMATDDKFLAWIHGRQHFKEKDSSLCGVKMNFLCLWSVLKVLERDRLDNWLLSKYFLVLGRCSHVFSQWRKIRFVLSEQFLFYGSSLVTFS